MKTSGGVGQSRGNIELNGGVSATKGKKETTCGAQGRRKGKTEAENRPLKQLTAREKKGRGAARPEESSRPKGDQMKEYCRKNPDLAPGAAPHLRSGSQIDGTSELELVSCGRTSMEGIRIEKHRSTRK